MVESRTSPRPIHIWVAGCATGEEAYSVAMCVSECLEETGIRAPVRIFATALSPLVLRAARAGIYPSRALAHVSQERLDRFFQKRNGDYVITRPIREMCRFARHDLANDVPLYGSLDLVTCRNVLLYLNRPTRLRILDAFHRALKPGGCLLLGKAEGMIENAGFRELDSRHRLFRKIPERGRA